MVKIRVLSDLHIEFGDLDIQPVEADVVVLAGDIHIGLQSAGWSRALAERLGIPVVLVAGNHEHYGGDRDPDDCLPRTIESLRAAAADSSGHLIFLERATTIVAGVRFVGATLWTDFAVFNDPSRGMADAQRGMTDFRVINYLPHVRFTPDAARREFLMARDFLKKELKTPYAGPTVVVTHHLPSARSVPEADDPLFPAYASGLDALVKNSHASLWVHGHSHVSADYRIGTTRVICNPRGYAGHKLNPRFDPSLVIEITSTSTGNEK